MIDIVINFDKERQEYKLYEPSTDTLLITTNLGESFMKLDGFLREKGMIVSDLLAAPDINYHLDSGAFWNLMESNIKLLKRLNSSPSGFMLSSQKFGAPTGSSIGTSKQKGSGRKKQGPVGLVSKKKANQFSKSKAGFYDSMRKFN